ncbi:hypothetical protein SAMN05421812_12338 [Asanoa hainanensis]|uniref:Uncharacterized protein n=1 Tax=Asanoa hainanensis TaxID=560556 RepID=A0A239PF36_9ACTN|nr:hypothetical protein [Asanoa hainanensis]SNT65485.1 hypothetical protein SAMN05421812_12338 [Asanoa hainanensis]
MEKRQRVLALGSGRHNYFIGVHALDVETLGIDKEATPAFLGFNKEHNQ